MISKECFIMAVSGQVVTWMMLTLALRGVVASGGMAVLLEDYLPYDCDEADDTCREALTDPQSLITNALYRQAGLEVPRSGSELQQSSSEEPVLSIIDCDFSFAVYPGLPIPFLCGWDLANNDVINWEPGDLFFNGFIGEAGPVTTTYAIARLNSQTATGTAGLLAPVVNGSIESITLAFLDFKYYLKGTPDDCHLSVKLIRKDGARIPLWSTDDNFSEGSWKDVELLEFHPPVPFQMVFESTLSPGAAEIPYTAVDDIKINVGALHSKYDCEADTIFPGTCGFIDLNGRWSYWSGYNATAEGKGPGADHTLGAASGHFLINVNTIWYEFGRERARLQTPEYFKWSDQTTCTLRMHYNARNTDPGDVVVSVAGDFGSQDYAVDLNDTEEWETHDIDLTGISGNYRVTIDVITASLGNHIALDDIGFLQDECLGRQFCRSSPCLNGGACSQSAPETFTCDCAEGYEGSDCSINIDECSLDTSLCAKDPLRVCQNASPGYKCVCKPGYMEYKGRCIQACSDNPCTRKDEVCLQNDNGYACQCKYGYIDSEDGECVKDMSGVQSGNAPYTQTVILGTYLGGSLFAVLVATLVVICYFSCCDEREEVDDSLKPDQALANYYNEGKPGSSGLKGNGTAAGNSIQNGGFEMEETKQTDNGKVIATF